MTKNNFLKNKIKAESGDPSAQRELADYFFSKNQCKNGLKWILKLSENKRATFRERAWAFQALGWMYENGEGVHKNQKRARLAYRVSNAYLLNLAKKGDVIAQRHLAENYAAGRGEKRNLKSSFIWSLKAAKLGDVESQYDVGLNYDQGFGVKKNEHLAFVWYLKAAKKGYPAAQCNIGYMFGNGQGTKQNGKKAIYWTCKAAAKKDDQALYNLGLAYEEGNYVRKDYRKAQLLIQKSANSGHRKAQMWIKRQKIK